VDDVDQPEDQESPEELESVETSGATVDEAVQRALEMLELTEEDVEVEVLAEPGPGVEARVRVTALPYEDEEYDEYDEEEGDEGQEAEGAVGAAEGEEVYADGEEGEYEDEEYEELPLTEAATAALELLEQTLDLMGIPAEIDVEEVEEEEGPSTIYLDLSGENMGLLIGRHGETLASLQLLLGLMLNKRMGGRKARVVVDAEGYRERRARLLRDIAFRAAERAQRSRQPVVLDPMLPAERRIVHLSLQEHGYVTTHSIGEGANRRVVITPRRAV
jgi:spoIIIJ-associated protein